MNRKRKPSERGKGGKKKKEEKKNPCSCFGGDAADLVDFEFMKQNEEEPVAVRTAHSLGHGGLCSWQLVDN